MTQSLHVFYEVTNLIIYLKILASFFKILRVYLVNFLKQIYFIAPFIICFLFPDSSMK